MMYALSSFLLFLASALPVLVGGIPLEPFFMVLQKCGLPAAVDALGTNLHPVFQERSRNHAEAPGALVTLAVLWFLGLGRGNNSITGDKSLCAVSKSLKQDEE